jgi:hypothetical protein
VNPLSSPLSAGSPLNPHQQGFISGFHVTLSTTRVRNGILRLGAKSSPVIADNKSLLTRRSFVNFNSLNVDSIVTWTVKAVSSPCRAEPSRAGPRRARCYTDLR